MNSTPHAVTPLTNSSVTIFNDCANSECRFQHFNCAWPDNAVVEWEEPMGAIICQGGHGHSEPSWSRHCSGMKLCFFI